MGMSDRVIELLEESNKTSKEYLEEYLKDDEEAQQHFPTIEDYDNCVAQLDDQFEVRIYDLAIYNITNSLEIIFCGSRIPSNVKC